MMKTAKQIIIELLHPHWLILLMLAAGCSAGLVTVFSLGLENSVFAYCLYPASAYTTCISCAVLIKWGMKLKKEVRQAKLLQPYFEDAEYRKLISVMQGSLVSFLFAAFKLTVSLIYNTSWDFAVGIYYLVLCLIRTNLMRVVKKGAHEHEIARMKTEWVNTLRTGIFMFVLNAAMSGMAVLMIWQNKGNAYPGYVIYVSALHAFYALISACVQMFKFRKSGRPVYYSINAVNLAGALMSIFILQAGLLQMFAESGAFVKMMNGLTGTAVLSSVFAMAVLMVVQGINRCKEFKDGSEK